MELKKTPHVLHLNGRNVLRATPKSGPIIETDRLSLVASNVPTLQMLHMWGVPEALGYEKDRGTY